MNDCNFSVTVIQPNVVVLRLLAKIGHTFILLCQSYWPFL